MKNVPSRQVTGYSKQAPIIPKKPAASVIANNASAAPSRVRQEPKFKTKKAANPNVSTSPEGGKMIQYLSLDDIPDITDSLTPTKSRQPMPLVFGNKQSSVIQDAADDDREYLDEEEDEEELKYIKKEEITNEYRSIPGNAFRIEANHNGAHHSNHPSQTQAERYQNSYSPVQAVYPTKYSEAKIIKAPASNQVSYQSNNNSNSSNHQQQRNNFDDFDHDKPTPRSVHSSGGKALAISNLPAFPADHILSSKAKAPVAAFAPKAYSVPSQPPIVPEPKQIPRQDFNIARDIPSKMSQQQYPIEPQRGGIDAGSEDKSYRPYTLAQYRQIRPKEYVEIPKIKPDLNRDDLVAKRANAERIKEFSKQLQDFNSQMSQNQRKLPPAAEMNDIAIAKSKHESKREKAAQFAKQIPKPKAETEAVLKKGSRRKSYGDDAANRVQMGASMDNDGCDYGGDEHMTDYFDDGAAYYGNSHAKEPSKLELLQAKHAQSKRQVDAIKASIGMK